MIKSLKKNKKGIIFILISSICVCIGQLFWKLAITGNLMYLIVGFIFYGIGAMLMLYAYKFGSLSVLQPMLSANYVFTIILAKMILREEINWNKLIGIVIIIFGVIMIGGGDD